LFLIVLTVGEIRKGIDMLVAGERNLKLLDWLEVELPTFLLAASLRLT